MWEYNYDYQYIFPDSLSAGDRVAIISPASPVNPEYIDQAAAFLRSYGLQPVIFPHAKGPASGSYAADEKGRLDDFIAAFSMPEIKAVICSRGGYGSVHLIPQIPGRLLLDNPKWLVGFSDISALHALAVTEGIASIHGPMVKHLHPDSQEGDELMALLTGNYGEDMIVNRDPALPSNQPGEADGILLGGNMAVLSGLTGTPFDLFGKALSENVILFIEDIAEPIYKIERILYKLYMQGVLPSLRGLIVGRFTDYRPDANYTSMEMMISDFLLRTRLTSLPVAYGFPIGHIDGNRPIIEGARMHLHCTPDTATLSFKTDNW